MAPDALAALHALWAKVGDFFARVEQRYPTEVTCAAGCFGCCAPDLTVTAVEAAAIRAHLAALPPAERDRIAAHSASPAHPGRCVALEHDGRCSIYDARPLVCRSHGVPTRMRDPRGLPLVDACSLNFTGTSPEAVDPACVLDQQTLSTVLLAVDAAHARATGIDPGRRTPLADVLAGV